MKINIVKKFYMGSNYFFNSFPDYVRKDIDILCIVNNYIFNSNNVRFKLGDEDIFLFKNQSKEEFIKQTLKDDVPMKVGKFLIPEFNNYLNFTIEDLKKLEGLFNNLDDQHKYEKIIYDSYLKNNDFTLNENQLEESFKEYKKYRNG